MCQNQQKINIFLNFGNEDFKIFREICINMILSTDMTKHFADISKVKARLSQDFQIEKQDKRLCMETLLHASDVSNPIKTWSVCF